jgi:hypothetical protein
MSTAIFTQTQGWQSSKVIACCQPKPAIDFLLKLKWLEQII